MMPPVRRYGALEMLAEHLNRSRGYGIPSQPGLAQELDPALRAFIEKFGSAPGMPPPALPPGLPDIVQESIRERPSYGESQITAPHQWYNPAFNEEPWRPEDSPERRESQLANELGINRLTRREGGPLPEGRYWTGLPPGRSPYARRPYNLGLGNLGALY